VERLKTEPSAERAKTVDAVDSGKFGAENVDLDVD
jgi:hypothetical protein